MDTQNPRMTIRVPAMVSNRGILPVAPNMAEGKTLEVDPSGYPGQVELGSVGTQRVVESSIAGPSQCPGNHEEASQAALIAKEEWSERTITIGAIWDTAMTACRELVSMKAVVKTPR